MAITQNHIINIQPGVSAPLVIHCSQGDTGTQINLTVVNGDEEFDCSSYACSVHGVRSDGGNWGPITCTVSGSTVCFSLTSAMTAVAGACLAEISVGTVGTANFAMLMENATFGNGVTYSNDVSVYQNILTAVQAGLSLAEAAVTNEKNERIAAITNEKDERIAAVNAEATARQTADNTLQGNINSEAATRASADSNLQSQINQIVAPSGEAPSAAEVQNARIGADGVTYDTLGTAIRTQVNNLKEDLNLCNDGYYAFDLIPNRYILRDTGIESDYKGWAATGFIPVPDNSLVICNSPSALVWGALYDKYKHYISAYGWPAGESELFFHYGEFRYFRISGPKEEMASLKYKILPRVDTGLTKRGYPADAYTVGNNLNTVNNRLTVLERERDAPDYYKSQLATKETIIRGHFDDCAFNGDGLVFLTDTHFSADLFTSTNPTSNFNANNSFLLIKDIISKCGIDKIVFGGDLVNSATDIDTMLYCMASFGNRFGDRQPRLRYCVGNHEYFTGNDLGQTIKPTPSELYGAGVKYNEDIVLGKGDMDTYYFDNKVQKIRYFVVSCGRNTETSVAQVKWVLEQFKAVPQGYKIICIGHGFMADNMAAFRGGYKPIADALDAVKVGGTYTYVYGTNLSTEYVYSALIDVTPVCMITGHTHIDGSLTTDGGIPCICTTTDSYALNYELVNGTPTLSPRNKGTTDEQAFDIFQFDFTNRKIYCTRIGYGSDREFSY